MKATIINVTPHPVRVLDDDDNEIATFEPSGTLFRLQTRIDRVGFLDDIPLAEVVLGSPRSIPSPKPDTFYIVSNLVKQKMPNRFDLLTPAERVYHHRKIIGCRSLGR